MPTPRPGPNEAGPSTIKRVYPPIPRKPLADSVLPSSSASTANRPFSSSSAPNLSSSVRFGTTTSRPSPSAVSRASHEVINLVGTRPRKRPAVQSKTKSGPSQRRRVESSTTSRSTSTAANTPSSSGSSTPTVVDHHDFLNEVDLFEYKDFDQVDHQEKCVFSSYQAIPLRDLSLRWASGPRAGRCATFGDEDYEAKNPAIPRTAPWVEFRGLATFTPQRLTEEGKRLVEAKCGSITGKEVTVPIRGRYWKVYWRVAHRGTDTCVMYSSTQRDGKVQRYMIVDMLPKDFRASEQVIRKLEVLSIIKAACEATRDDDKVHRSPQWLIRTLTKQNSFGFGSRNSNEVLNRLVVAEYAQTIVRWMRGDPLAKKHFPNRAEFEEWADDRAPHILKTRNRDQVPFLLPSLEEFFSREWRKVRSYLKTKTPRTRSISRSSPSSEEETSSNTDVGSDSGSGFTPPPPARHTFLERSSSADLGDMLSSAASQVPKPRSGPSNSSNADAPVQRQPAASHSVPKPSRKKKGPTVIAISSDEDEDRIVPQSSLGSVVTSREQTEDRMELDEEEQRQPFHLGRERPKPPKPIFPALFKPHADLLRTSYQNQAQTLLPRSLTPSSLPVGPPPIWDGIHVPHSITGTWICSMPDLSGKTKLNALGRPAPERCLFEVHEPLVAAEGVLSKLEMKVFEAQLEVLGRRERERVRWVVKNEEGLQWGMQMEGYTRDWDGRGEGDAYHPVLRAVAKIVRAHWCWHLWAKGLVLYDPRPENRNQDSDKILRISDLPKVQMSKYCDDVLQKAATAIAPRGDVEYIADQLPPSFFSLLSQSASPSTSASAPSGSSSQQIT